MAEVDSRDNSDYFAHKNTFVEFLNSDARELQIAKRVEELVSADGARLHVDMNDVRRFDTDLAQA